MVNPNSKTENKRKMLLEKNEDIKLRLNEIDEELIYILTQESDEHYIQKARALLVKALNLEKESDELLNIATKFANENLKI